MAALLEQAKAAIQITELLAISSGYHVVKLAGNLIDDGQGVIEHRVSQLLARRLLRHLDLTVETSGEEHLRGLERYAVVCSHASHLDWAVLLACFPSPLRFIAKRELASMPVVGSYLKLRGVLIDRQRGIDAVRAIRAAVTDGPQAWPILIFPEGTRSPDGRVHRFKSGGLRVLLEAGLTLVPVRISGTFEAMPRDAWQIKTGRQLRMSIGRPVPPPAGGQSDEAIVEIERRVRELA